MADELTTAIEKAGAHIRATTPGRKITWWMRFKHDYGYHTWGEWQHWYPEGTDRSNDYGCDCEGTFMVCELCPAIKVVEWPN